MSTSDPVLEQLQRHYDDEAPAGLGPSLLAWLCARSGYPRRTVKSFIRQLRRVRPLDERNALVEQARERRAAEEAETHREGQHNRA